jgi:hypothetical protein
MSQWTAFDMTAALTTAVAARSGVTTLTPTVRVISYLPSPDEQMPDAIVIGYLAVDSDDHQRAHAGGNRFDEEVNLISRVQVTRPGAGQDVANTVRTRAEVLLAEVDAEVRTNLPTVGDQAWAGKVVDRDMAVIATIRQGVAALVCAIDFNINYSARTS